MSAEAEIAVIATKVAVEVLDSMTPNEEDETASTKAVIAKIMKTRSS